MAPALILANEHGAGFELATWRMLVSREALQELQAVAIKTAKSSLPQTAVVKQRDELEAAE